MKTKWLDRRIACAGPYLTLCLAQDEFDAALKYLKVKHAAAYVNEGAWATAHNFTNHKGDVVTLVCISDFKDRSPVEVAGTLVHEAVHVWQNYCQDIGENEPGREQEAYAIQMIAQELMSEFARRLNEVKQT